MRRAVFLLGAAVVGGFAAGWFAVVSTAPTLAPVIAARWERPVHGGAVAAAAAERFVEMGLGVPEAPQIVELPPPPDIAVVFRRDLTAIERRAGGALAWVIDLNQMSGRRGLSVGDVYRDGWRVSAVSEQVIELRKRREVRRISVFELPQESEP
jgi:hypothetical protein